jgi:L-threonylcarbamoyladenylate synthase
MILYPTETLYALGVNALDVSQLTNLYVLKGRDSTKVASWLVRDVADIERYAELGSVGAEIAKQFLPGQLTLVLPVKDTVPKDVVAPDGTIGFRISADPMAQTIVSAFMAEYDAPLTCTSANVSGAPTMPTVSEILQQFGPRANMIDHVHDDGPRKGLASTVVRVRDELVGLLREGEITAAMINEVVGKRR